MTPVDIEASIPIGLGAARMARMRSNWSSGMREAQGLLFVEVFFADFLEAIMMYTLNDDGKWCVD
jgi:hypothetical protein